MRLRYRVTEQDFARISLFIYYRRPLNLFLILAVPFFLFMQFRNADYDFRAVPAFAYLLPVFVFLMLPLSVWFGARRAYHRSGLLRSETDLSIDESGFHFQIGDSRFDYTREDLTRMVSLWGFRILEFRGRRMHPVPNRVLSLSDIEELKKLASSRKGGG